MTICYSPAGQSRPIDWCYRRAVSSILGQSRGPDGRHLVCQFSGCRLSDPPSPGSDCVPQSPREVPVNPTWYSVSTAERASASDRPAGARTGQDRMPGCPENLAEDRGWQRSADNYCDEKEGERRFQVLPLMKFSRVQVQECSSLRGPLAPNPCQK